MYRCSLETSFAFLSSLQSSAVEQVLGTVSPHRPFCSCLLECYIVTVHGQIMICILLLPLVLLSNILPSKIPCRKLSCLSTCPIHLCFRCHILFSRLLSSSTFLSLQLIFSSRLQIHISKASIFILYASLKVPVTIEIVSPAKSTPLTS